MDQSAAGSDSDTPPSVFVQSPIRSAISTDIFTTLFMPASITRRQKEESQTEMSVKVVSVPKGNGDGLPATTLTFDTATGKVDAIVNSGQLTGVRTAAASALSLQLLPNRKRSCLVVFGSGTQAFHHIQFLTPLLEHPIELYVVGRNQEGIQSLFRKIQQQSFKSVQAIDLADEKAISGAIRRADVICLCTPSTRPLFCTTDVKKPCHIIAVGSYKASMIEFDLQALAKQEPGILITVDSKEACLAEAGELVFVKEAPRSVDLCEIGSLVGADGNASLRSNAEITVYKSVGNGAMDVAITNVVVAAARRLKLGHNIDL